MIMELRQVKKKTTWNDAANVINDNAQIIAQKIVSLEAGRGNQKGYFASLDALQSAYPVAGIGDTAYVGTTYPYAIYKYTESGWVDTGATGGEASNAYTKQESDDKFLSKSGGTINGHLRVQGDILTDADEQDIGESSRPFNRVYASEFIEGGKSLSSKYATKEEAYDFVNVGSAMGLNAAITLIGKSLRQTGQVITFYDDSQDKAAKYSFSLKYIKSIDKDNDVELTLKVGDRDITDTYYPSNEALNSDGTFDYAKINEELFEYIKSYVGEYAPDIVDLTNSYYSNGNIYLTLQKGLSAAIRIETNNVEKIEYDSVLLQQSTNGKFVNYQYKGTTTDDVQYLDVSNWKEYMTENKIFWKGFFN